MRIKSVQAKSVHYLQGGYAPCGIEGIPKEWPEGHYWSVSWDDVTCTKCLSLRPLYSTMEALGKKFSEED